MIVFCFKQTPAYEMRISDWSSDVCSPDRARGPRQPARAAHPSLPVEGAVAPHDTQGTGHPGPAASMMIGMASARRAIADLADRVGRVCACADRTSVV